MTTGADTIRQIEAMFEVGLSVSEAIPRALGCSITEFAARQGFRQPEVSMCLLGYHQRVYPDIRDAICKELEIPREKLDAWIEEQAGREPANQAESA